MAEKFTFPVMCSSIALKYFGVGVPFAVDLDILREVWNGIMGVQRH
jgi:hypothetical protein